MTSTKLFPLSNWTRLSITGEDRQNFINNFCTNNIRTLSIGAGLEAFVTDAKGHILGHGWFWALEDELLFDTVPEQGRGLIAHWDRYVIRERVEFADRTAIMALWCLAGVDAEPILSNYGSAPVETMRVNTLQIAGIPVLAARVPWLTEPSWLLSCEASHKTIIEDTLRTAGVATQSSNDWDTTRITAGLPLFGQDFSAENLPQELARDKLAISFTKGCYLGQEPIARIDALGQVNKLLVGLRWLAPGKEVKLPLELNVDGKIIGKVTSLASNGAALGMVRRAQAVPGTIVESSAGSFEVL